MNDFYYIFFWLRPPQFPNLVLLLLESLLFLIISVGGGRMWHCTAPRSSKFYSLVLRDQPTFLQGVSTKRHWFNQEFELPIFEGDPTGFFFWQNLHLTPFQEKTRSSRQMNLIPYVSSIMPLNDYIKMILIIYFNFSRIQNILFFTIFNF